ncbi:MAG TPA: PhzF family phenazine biosynthesis protein [bacterium]|nr:PhzF family phenazine biosynthesis protein [bacterium]HPN46145.1 PhzF family phenazine biosynthesis protein [bacterium]
MLPKIYQVDAFSAEPFKGNPAGVCLLEKQMDERLMQQIAMEMNVSETAFVLKIQDGYKLRWFTPVVEVELCGHATLATAHILYEEGLLQPDEQARFHTRSGLLTVSKKETMLEMDFPVEPEKPVDAPPILIRAFGAQPVYTGKNRMDYLFQFDSEKLVREMKPDFHMLREIPVRGVIVTARVENGGYDFISRFFAPYAGIDEDPVTGSAHCCLGPFWQKQTGKDDFIAYQASARGGIVHVGVRNNRVLLGGRAVTVIKGEINI